MAIFNGVISKDIKESFQAIMCWYASTYFGTNVAKPINFSSIDPQKGWSANETFPVDFQDLPPCTIVRCNMGEVI